MIYKKFKDSIELRLMGITMFLSACTAQGKQNLPDLSRYERALKFTADPFLDELTELRKKELATNLPILRAEYARQQETLYDTLEDILDCVERLWKMNILKGVTT